MQEWVNERARGQQLSPKQGREKGTGRINGRCYSEDS